MKPHKKVPETDAIFENVAAANAAADADPTVLRLSIDSKAKVAIGNLSRGGGARILEPRQADDHDHYREATLVPFGILDVKGEQLSIYFGQSAETSDFMMIKLTLIGLLKLLLKPHLMSFLYRKTILQTGELVL